MPRIKPYESQVSSQGDLPSRSAGVQDFGGAGLSNLGQGFENLGQSAGQAQRILNEARSRQEVTDEHIAHIDSSSRVMQQLEEKAKSYVAIDPETGRRNPTMSELAPGLVKAELDQRGLTEDGGSFYETQAGQNAFRTNAAMLSQHFVGVASQMDSRLAGEAATEKLRSTTDKLGAQVYAHPVPAQVALSMGQAAKLVKDPNGEFAGIPAQHQNKVLRDMQEAIATRAVEGSIRQFPNQTLRILQQPPEARDEQYNYIAQYVPNEKINSLINSAETEVRALEVEAARLRADENRQRIEMARASEFTLIEKLALHMEDPKQPMVSARDVLDSDLSKLDPEKGKAMLSLIHAWSREDPHKPIHTNPVVEHNLFKKIHLPDGDPKKIIDTAPIYEAYQRGQLSFVDMDKLRRELVESRSPDGSVFGREKADFIKSIEPQITKPGPWGMFADPTNGEKLLQFKRDVDSTIAKYRKEKKKDPRSLFDPDSQDYLWKPGKRQKYVSSGFGSIQQGPPATKAPSSTPRKSLDEIFGKKP
jgi:hypothetical protein